MKKLMCFFLTAALFLITGCAKAPPSMGTLTDNILASLDYRGKDKGDEAFHDYPFDDITAASVRYVKVGVTGWFVILYDETGEVTGFETHAYLDPQLAHTSTDMVSMMLVCLEQMYPDATDKERMITLQVVTTGSSWGEPLFTTRAPVNGEVSWVYNRVIQEPYEMSFQQEKVVLDGIIDTFETLHFLESQDDEGNTFFTRYTVRYRFSN